jgi:hypothetical protein
VQNNKERVVEALKDGETLSYAELRERSEVPVGSFDRVLNGAMADGAIARADGGYSLGDGSGDGSTPVGAIGPGESPIGTVVYAWCARCESSHVKVDGASFEDAHNAHARELAVS